MGEIAAEVHEGPAGHRRGAGLQVMAAMMAADMDALCGPRGKHDPDRTATGTAVRPGRSPWAGAACRYAARGSARSTGRGSYRASYEAFSSTEVLGRKAMEAMLAGLSSRRYQRRAGTGRAGAAKPGDGKSAISRRFVAATEPPSPT